MARLFFAVASASEASNILVLGSFQGAALVWFAAARPTAECLGVDICPLATQRAQANIAAMGLSAKVRAMDGYALADEVGPQFDLVLVDVESPVDGRASKKICATMLRALRRRIAADAVVLVHDACWAPFANDMALVRQELDTANGYPNTTSFAIDRYGVMLARRCNP